MSIETCSLVGTGVAGRALALAMTAAGVRVVSVAGRGAGAVQELARQVGAEARDVGNAGAGADLILLTITDSAIAHVCEKLSRTSDLSGTVVAHTAGGLGLEPLKSAREAGARVGKLHPVASLSGGPERLTGAVWGLQAEEDLLPELRKLVERLGGLPIDLSRADLRRYHLAAVFASNFLLGLIGVAVRLWEDSAAPLPAREALLPLARGTLANWEAMGLEDALTGAIARGDVSAVESQLALVEHELPELEDLYRALAVASFTLAENRSTRPDRMAQIGRVLAKNGMVD